MKGKWSGASAGKLPERGREGGREEEAEVKFPLGTNLLS